MTPISRTLNVMAYILSSITKETAHGKSTKTTVINLANFDFPCHKRLLNIAKQFETGLQTALI